MEEHINYIGTRSQWETEIPFGIGARDRRSHVHIIGQTGVGKSMLLKNMILQDIEEGQGVAVIDPHGSLVKGLLTGIPRSRTDDVVYFAPGDLEFPVGFNIMKNVPSDKRHLVAAGAVSIFKNLWSDSWGPRLEYILHNCLASLLECQNVSLLGLQRMLNDHSYLRWVIRQVKDGSLKSFWINEFNEYDDRYRREAIAPIQNKVGQMVNSPASRNVLGQVTSKFDPAFMMNNRRILLANLSVGALGHATANLLGGILVNQFELAAMERESMDEADRKDFFMYIDEFQNFATDSFETTLSECRKYRLCLTLAHQYFDQLREPIRNAVFGNIGTTVAFRVGELDSKILARKFGGNYPERQFSELDNQEVAVKLLSNGKYGEPFIGRTMRLEYNDYGGGENILRRSREKYGTKREKVETKLKRWRRAYC